MPLSTTMSSKVTRIMQFQYGIEVQVKVMIIRITTSLIFQNKTDKTIQLSSFHIIYPSIIKKSKLKYIAFSRNASSCSVKNRMNTKVKNIYVDFNMHLRFPAVTNFLRNAFCMTS